MLKYAVKHTDLVEHPNTHLDGFHEAVYIARAVDARITELEKAAKAVCAYDWSDNDEDAARTIDKLRAVLGN